MKSAPIKVISAGERNLPRRCVSFSGVIATQAASAKKSTA